MAVAGPSIPGRPQCTLPAAGLPACSAQTLSEAAHDGPGPLGHPPKLGVLPLHKVWGPRGQAKAWSWAQEGHQTEQTCQRYSPSRDRRWRGRLGLPWGGSENPEGKSQASLMRDSREGAVQACGRPRQELPSFLRPVPSGTGSGQVAQLQDRGCPLCHSSPLLQLSGRPRGAGQGQGAKGSPSPQATKLLPPVHSHTSPPALLTAGLLLLLLSVS